MPVQTKRVATRFFIFGFLGLLMEVSFGAILALKNGNWNMHGQSSPWMIIDYGLIGVILIPIARPLIRKRIPLVLRAVVYMLAIFLVEFVTGWIFDLCGLVIWDYSNLPYNLYGYITLTYAPLWYGLALVIEYAYRKVDAVALALVLGISADDIEARFSESVGTRSYSGLPATQSLGRNLCSQTFAQHLRGARKSREQRF